MVEQCNTKYKIERVSRTRFMSSMNNIIPGLVRRLSQKMTAPSRECQFLLSPHLKITYISNDVIFDSVI